jgi:hypothetical protein
MRLREGGADGVERSLLAGAGVDDHRAPFLVRHLHTVEIEEASGSNAVLPSEEGGGSAAKWP